MSISSVSAPDSIINIVQSYRNKAIEQKDSFKLIEITLTLSDIYKLNENYSKSFDLCGEALFMAEQFRNTYLLSEAYNKYGILNYLFYQKKEALKYLNKSVEFSKQLKGKNGNIPQLKSRYFSLAQAYRQFNNYNTALCYLDSCHMLGVTNTQYIDSEKGIILTNQKKFKIAIPVLKHAIKQFNNINILKDDVDSKGYLLVIYSYLAEAYEGIGDTNKALSYYDKSYSSLENNKRYMSHKASILERYGQLEYKTGKYKKAYAKLQEAYKLNEKHFSTRTVSNTDFITTRDKYQEHINLKNKEIAKKNLFIAEHNQKMLHLKIIVYTVILLLFLITFIILNRQKIKKRKNTMSAIVQKQEEAKSLLVIKNKELTAFTLKLIEKDKIIKSLTDHLKSTPVDKQTNSLLNTIKHENTNLWNDFNTRFIAVNENFYNNLNTKFPNLSPGDLKICALIKLNFSGKEMAHLLGVSINSVNKARYRLRKKIDLDRKVNLTTYISSF